MKPYWPLSVLMEALLLVLLFLARLQLEGGRTAHSRFKIPVQGLDATNTCYVNRNGPLAELIRATDLIVWDDAPIMHKHDCV
jgi:hypothetical protein